MNMKKVIVIGCPGSGKSTFSIALHNKTGLPLYHLDMINWNPDKTTVPKEVFLERLTSILQKDEWIIDGNYGSTMEMRLKECDTVFFLDYPVEVCLEGLASRKGKTRPDMPWIERTVETDWEFLAFVKNYNSESRPKVLHLLDKYAGKEVYFFKSRSEVDEFLKRL